MVEHFEKDFVFVYTKLITLFKNTLKQYFYFIENY